MLPSCSLICILRSNTDTMEHPGDHSVHLYARCPIPAGTQLTTSYIQATQPTMLRRHQLFNTWNFWCCCPVCRDNTEEGTYRSGSRIFYRTLILHLKPRSSMQPKVSRPSPPSVPIIPQILLGLLILWQDSVLPAGSGPASVSDQGRCIFWSERVACASGAN